jgi:hypothetical protein
VKPEVLEGVADDCDQRLAHQPGADRPAVEREPQMGGLKRAADDVAQGAAADDRVKGV